MKRLLAASLLALLASNAALAASPGDFSPCADASGALCATLQLPLDHRHPAGEKIALSLRDFPAAAPARGQVWLLTGESGAALYPMIGTLHQAFPGYDLIIPDRRGTGSASSAAYDLQAEIDHYAGSGAVLLYGTAKGADVVLKALSLVQPRRVKAVILDRPAAPLSATGPEESEGPGLDLGLPVTLPRTLLMQTESDPALLGEYDKNAPITTYRFEGAPGFLMMTLPECAAPLVRGFVEGTEGGAPCAAKLMIRF